MKTYNELVEGLQDPNIFKAFFLAGGPGSGKSFVTKKVTGGLGLKVINSDDIFEKYLKAAGLEMDMTTPQAEVEKDQRDALRDRSKALTVKKGNNYVSERLGIIIDGTGRDYDKITAESNRLKQLGYVTYMIYVNTSLDVALARNAERERKVHTSIATRSWKDVQANLGKFSQHFRGNLIVVDNNDVKEDDGTLFNGILRQVRGRAKKNVTNTTAKNWVAMKMAERGITKAPKGF